MNLSKRLEMVYNQISPNKIVADIGTDHALLPIKLILEGRAKLVYACDIAETPLEKAKSAISHYQLQHSIKSILSNGLEAITQLEGDIPEEIVIAGMGSQTIINIISDCLNFSKSSKHLIIQPMTKDEILRKFLLENGFSIENESCVVENSHVYSSISAKFSGEFVKNPSLLRLIAGDFLGRHDSVSIQYKRRKITQLTQKLKSFKNQQNSQEYDKILSVIDEISRSVNNY